MINKDNFAKWLGIHVNLSTNSIGKYANAIDTISSD
ncbi:Protein of unknown function [Bacillus wiedmannii]|uniref:Uncharacterized protein n=1 Tax=Bacillus wiedmannii TaxID=1890302 RepID=A0A1C4FCY9_9BACI|nr:Protein of unknown function [Bacillus wiedmannii]